LHDHFLDCSSQRSWTHPHTWRLEGNPFITIDEECIQLTYATGAPVAFPSRDILYRHTGEREAVLQLPTAAFLGHIHKRSYTEMWYYLNASNLFETRGVNFGCGSLLSYRSCGFVEDGGVEQTRSAGGDTGVDEDVSKLGGWAKF